MLWFIPGRKCTWGDGCNQSNRASERGKASSGSFMKKRWLSWVAIQLRVHSPAQNYFWFYLSVPRAVEVHLQEITYQTMGTYLSRKSTGFYLQGTNSSKRGWVPEAVTDPLSLPKWLLKGTDVAPCQNVYIWPPRQPNLLLLRARSEQ